MKHLKMGIMATFVAMAVSGCSDPTPPVPEYTAPVSEKLDQMPEEMQGERFLQAPDGSMMTAAAMIAAGMIVGEVAGEAAEYYFDKKRGKYYQVPAHYHSRYWKKDKRKDGSYGFVVMPMYRNNVMSQARIYNTSVVNKTYVTRSRTSTGKSSVVTSGRVSAKGGVFGGSSRGGSSAS